MLLKKYFLTTQNKWLFPVSYQSTEHNVLWEYSECNRGGERDEKQDDENVPEDLLIDLAYDEDKDEVLDDDEGVLEEVQHWVRLEDEEARVETVAESKSTCVNGGAKKL